MLIREEIAGLHNGVSQQPASQRLNTQVDEMVNAYPSLNQGLLRRNPTENILFDGSVTYEDDMYQYNYDRGDSHGLDERYVVNFLSTGIEILDITEGRVLNEANGKINYVGNSKQYITDNYGGSNGFNCLTIKDTTFVVNKNVTCEMQEDLSSSAGGHQAFIWVKRAELAYGYIYNFYISNDSTYTSGSKTAKSSTIVADDFENKINSNTNMTAVADGSIVKITSNTPINITVGDSYGNEAIVAFKDTVEIIEDLPTSFPYSGVKVKVLGKSGDRNAYYYVESIDNIWQESVSHGVKYKIDSSTMPHVLRRNANGTFTFEAFEYSNREVGDEDTNENPIFIDSQIKDIFFLRNRLGFLTSSGLVLSEVASFNNFFRTSTVSQLDSDRISINISSNQAINLEHSIPFENTVMLVSENQQFTLLDTEVLTPSTIAFNETSRFRVNTAVKPLYLNKKLYIPIIRGDKTSMEEVYISGDGKITSNEITLHCQTYVPVIDRFVGSQSNGIILMSRKNDNTIYVNKITETNDERFQNAWFKWTISGIVLSMFATKNVLFLLTRRDVDSNVAQDWILVDGSWDDAGSWDDDSPWLDDIDSLNFSNYVEAIRLNPQDISDDFLDIGFLPFQTDILYGNWIPTIGQVKDYRTKVKWIKAGCSSGKNSEFNFYQIDDSRGYRETSVKNSTERYPSIFGDTKRTKIGIKSSSNKGFSIGTVIFEGNATQKTRRL